VFFIRGAEKRGEGEGEGKEGKERYPRLRRLLAHTPEKLNPA